MPIFYKENSAGASLRCSAPLRRKIELMNKDTYIRTRLGEETKNDFDAVCQALQVVPSEQLRMMIEEFVARHNGPHTSPYILQIYRPEGYDYGVWRVTISLRNPENGLWGGTPIPFALPELPSRIVDSDPEYRAIVVPNVERGPVLGGRFDKGVWRGHIRTNGCEEDLNPTPLQKVKEAIRESIDGILARFHGYDSFVQKQKDQAEQYGNAHAIADWIRRKVIWTKSRKAAGLHGTPTPGVFAKYHRGL